MSEKTLSLLVRVINSNPIKKTKKYMFIFLEPIKTPPKYETIKNKKHTNYYLSFHKKTKQTLNYLIFRKSNNLLEASPP